MAVKLRRSLLYVPASSDKMLRKAGSRGADTLIFDLEDGVHPDAKTEGRDRLGRLALELDFGGAEVFIRVNSPGTPWVDEDLEMVARTRPAGVVLPKVEHSAWVRDVDRRLDGEVPMLLMIETAAGVLASPELARTSPQVSGLVFGAADFRESLRAGRLPEEMELYYARNRILLAARAAGIEAFDTPWFAYKDPAGLEASARLVRQMGFDGKTAIHPSQVSAINEVFSPTVAEIERARRIVDAMKDALAGGRYVATVGNEMVEALHLEEAKRTLARAKAIGLAVEDG
jgi:citrate lyase subunit beta/citryl-CoA lyase